VFFESPDQSFLAKFTGTKPAGVDTMIGPLNFQSILQLAKETKV